MSDISRKSEDSAAVVVVAVAAEPTTSAGLAYPAAAVVGPAQLADASKDAHTAAAAIA